MPMSIYTCLRGEISLKRRSITSGDTYKETITKREVSAYCIVSKEGFIMYKQKSFEDDGQGILYLVPTPIGNLEDMTFRAIRILKEVDLILAEDMCHTKMLLNDFDIYNKLLSYHEHNQRERTIKIIEKLECGDNLELVNDAGMSAISDPGNDLVKHIIEKNL